MAEENQTDLTALTVQLVSAFVSNNTVASDSLADLIKTTRAALTEKAAPAVEEPAAATFTPAVSVRKSLSSPEHIISLIDGKPYKTLKRHLAANDLTPEQYRERYKLPKTYPLVAPSYSESRRAVAEKIGLGKKPVAAAKPAEAAPAPATAPKAKAAVKAKAPKKVATAPAKTPANADVSPAVKAEPAAAASPKAAAKKEARKRLSIAAPKADTADAKAEAAPIAPTSKDKPAAKKAAVVPKAKSVSKPKSSKAALNAAGSPVGADTKAAEPAPVKA